MALTAKLTAIGQSKQAAYLIGGAAAQITKFALGDGGGNPVVLPNPPVNLVNKVHEASINRVYYSGNVPIVEVLVPTNIGGFTVRELSLIDSNNDVIAVVVVPDSVKPLPASGASKLSIYNIAVEVTTAAFVTELVIDSTAVLATKANLTTEKNALIAMMALLMPTGSELAYWGSTAPDGFVLASGRTIGNAASGATERANDDTEPLYTLLWNSVSNTQLQIQTNAGSGTTRGASASADFAAGKRMPLPDLRGRVGVGLDNMGGTAASRMNVTLTGTRASTSSGVITGLSSTTGLAVGMVAIGTGIAAGATILSIDSATQVTLSSNSSSTGSGSIRFGILDGATIGASGGSQIHTLTTPQIPSHTHNTTSQSAGTITNGGAVTYSTNSGNSNGTTPTAATGGGQAHPNVPPSIVRNVLIKL